MSKAPLRKSTRHLGHVDQHVDKSQPAPEARKFKPKYLVEVVIPPYRPRRLPEIERSGETLDTKVATTAVPVPTTASNASYASTSSTEPTPRSLSKTAAAKQRAQTRWTNTRIAEATLLSKRPADEVVLHIDKIPFCSRSIASILNPKGVLATTDIDCYLHSLRASTSSTGPWLAPLSTHFEILGYRAGTTDASWFKHITLQRRPRLLFPVFDMVSPSGHGALIILDMTLRRFEYHSNSAKTESLLQLFKSKYIKWVTDVSALSQSSSKVDSRVWSDEIHHFKLHPNLENIQHTPIAYCIATENRMHGALSPESAFADAAIIAFRRTMINAIMQAGTIVPPSKTAATPVAGHVSIPPTVDANNQGKVPQDIAPQSKKDPSEDRQTTPPYARDDDSDISDYERDVMMMDEDGSPDDDSD